MEESISFQTIEISPFEVEQLLDVHIEHQVNEHSTFYFKALLSQEKKDRYVKESRLGSNVVLSYKKEDGGSEILFQGMVQNVEVNLIRDTYYIEVYGISYSYLLDVEKKSRTFQNKKMSYNQLIQQVSADYQSAVLCDVVTKGEVIGQLIVQYEETDWEFLKRLASHFHTSVVNSCFFNGPKCYFGIPDNRKHTLKIFDYRVKKDIAKYMKLLKSGIDGIAEHDFVYYRVETKIPVSIGDQIEFQGKLLFVYKIKAYMEQGIFVYHITLTPKNGFTMPYQWHERIAGCSLNATIAEIKNDQVKVSIKIDEYMGHSPGQSCYFLYSTIYSSSDGSGWYCMPEIGDSVRIYFPDSTEEHSYAISSVHEAVTKSSQQSTGNSNSSYSGQRDDPSVKSLRNQNGKEIRLTPEGIYIISDGTIITLTDEGGVSIMSDQNIEFKSDQSIILNAQEDVNIIGLTGVDLSCNETASIKMKENVEVIGQEVKAN